jgi:outer membrane protein TolC
MRLSLVFVPCLFIVQLHVAAQGQPPVNRNKTTNPTNTLNQGVPVLPPVRMTDLSDTANENRLVALALKGPEFDATVHQDKINELELKRAKGTWLNLLSISTNYNDQSFAKQPAGGQAAYVYPKYFFGVTIPLGIIFSQGNQVKTARESIANGKDQQEILARTIRASVLSKYKQYKEYATLIEMQSELMNDVLANATQAEQNFKSGTITVDIYIAAQRTKNEELVKSLNLQLSQDLVRIDIERMIGIPLDEALRPVTPAPGVIRNNH